MGLYRKVDDTFEIRIEQSRVVIVGVGAVLLVALIFLLGVLVGKALWEGEGRTPAHRMPSAADTPLPAAEPGARKDYGFYDDVKRPEAAEAPHDPLRRAAPDEESRDPAAAVEMGRSGAAPGPEAEAAPSPVPATPAAPAAPVPQANPDARQALPAPVFTIQVGSFKDRAAARALLEGLKAKGIKAELATVSIEGQDWYRIQVGRYTTRSEAEKAYRAKLLPAGVKGFVLAR